MTLDDELIGTRSQYNPVKKISDRKADREGQSVDCLADALFRLILDWRLHRRGESHISSVKTLLSNLQENRGYISLRTAFFIAYRGYVRPEFMELVRGFGYDVFLIAREHMLSVNQFVAS